MFSIARSIAFFANGNRSRRNHQEGQTRPNTLAARRPDTRKEARDRVEQERNRHRGFKRRPRTKDE
jgi:hypothetical protein